MGSICKGGTGRETVICNRIAVKETNLNNLANHHFQIKIEVKDVDIEGIFMKMYNEDFCENKLVAPDQSIKQDVSEINERINRNGFWLS